MKPSRPSLFGRAVGHVHLVGAAGQGMSALARLLWRRGFAISLEDGNWTGAARRRFGAAGMTIVADPAMVPAETGLVVAAATAGPGHPAWRAAEARGVPVVRRGAALAELVRDRRLVAVVGAPGREVAAAMVVCTWLAAGGRCGWVLSGLWRPPEDYLTAPEAMDDDTWIVAGLDEHDGSLAGFAPAITLLVSGPEGLAVEAGWAAELAGLGARTTDALVFNADDVAARRWADEAGGRAARCGVGAAGDFRWRMTGREEQVATLELGGRFAVREARVATAAPDPWAWSVVAAARAVAEQGGLAPAAQRVVLFPSGERRPFSWRDTPRLLVLEDNARHPLELDAVVREARRRTGPGGRVVLVLGPERAADSAGQRAELVAAVAGADEVWVLEGDPAPDLLTAFPAGGSGPVARGWDGNAAALRAALRPGDTLAWVGTGDQLALVATFLEECPVAPADAATWAAWRAEARPRLGPATVWREQEPLGPKTTLRVGGPARCYAEPADEAELAALLATACARGLPVFPLGRGSNLLVPDEGVDGLVIALAHPRWQTFHLADDGRVWAGAGLRLKNLCGRALRAGLAGFEFLEGIPATVGGALRMNAGAMGGWMFDVVDEVHLMTLDGVKQVRGGAELHHDYRQCGELATAFALGAWLRPRPGGDAAAIRAALAAGQRRRLETQPREPSAGCIFKNPPGTSAGRLIDQAGLKGARVGDAEVSAIHANFIINRGQATCADVLALIRQVRAAVRAAHGVGLTPEVMLLGRAWREVL